LLVYIFRSTIKEDKTKEKKKKRRMNSQTD
jgi:hypothetical protein